MVSTSVYSLSAEPFLYDGKNWSFYCAEEIAFATFKRPVMIILDMSTGSFKIL